MGVTHLLLRTAIGDQIVADTTVEAIGDAAYRKATRLDRGDTVCNVYLYPEAFDYEYDANQRHEQVAITAIVAHRLEEPGDELLYVVGTAATALQKLLDPIWRRAISGIVEVIDVDLEAPPAPLEGNVIEYTVGVTALINPT